MNSSNTNEYESGYLAERPILMVAGLVAIAAIPIGLLMALVYGSVRGTEFSPDDFSRRDFSYQQVPWLNWTISGIEYTDRVPELEQTLLTERLIKRRKRAGGEPKTWHLSYDADVPDSHACDARILTKYLDFEDWDSKNAISTPFWLKWNKKFPQSAKIFWPTVADLARGEMYLSIPQVMRFALDVVKDQPDSFQTGLNEVIRKSWVTAGEADFQTGNYQRAAERLCRAKAIAPSGKLAKLIGQCQSKADDFSAIQSRAAASAEELKAEILEALSDDDGTQSSSGKITAEADESSEP